MFSLGTLILIDYDQKTKPEGQLLVNLEEVYGVAWLEKELTRITCTSETLLDVILTNKPEHFRASGLSNPEISDHHITYGIITDKVFPNKRKTTTFRSAKAMDVEQFNKERKKQVHLSVVDI